MRIRTEQPNGPTQANNLAQKNLFSRGRCKRTSEQLLLLLSYMEGRILVTGATGYGIKKYLNRI